jgi:hypothetical protein
MRNTYQSSFSITIAIIAATALFGSARGEIRSSNASDADIGQGAPREISVHQPNPYAGLGPQSRGLAHSHGPGGSTSSGNGISYHGGPLILGGANVYLIWYGNWSGDSATTIVTDFLQSIGGSPYYNINTSYYDASYTHITNSVQYSGATTDNYSRGSSLSDSDIQTIVSSALSSGRLPVDAKGVYLVLTSADVTETSGFCSQYCGWHTYGNLASSYIKYAFIGNPARCLSACSAQSVGPNGNAGADAMVSIIAHELEEANTDPELNAWYDSNGEENADKCAWTYGSVYRLSSGAYYNLVLGGHYYLIQRNWVDANGGYCSLSY